MAGPGGQTVPTADGGTTVVVLDGRPRLAGYTPTAFTGSLGGRNGANTKCSAAFANSHLCGNEEYVRATPLSAPGLPAYIDNVNKNGDPLDSGGFTCGAWTGVKPPGATLLQAAVVNPTTGLVSVDSNLSTACTVQRSLACCYDLNTVRFVGYTTLTYSPAAIGGVNGAHSKCDAVFSGSHFCTTSEYQKGSPKTEAVSASAYIDPVNMSDTGDRALVGSCNRWTGPDVGGSTVGTVVNMVTGEIGPSQRQGFNSACEAPLPLACCK